MQKLWFKEPRFAWALLAVLWLTAFSGKLSRFVLAVYQGELAHDLHRTGGWVAGVWSVNLLVTALCAPVGGWLTDRYGPGKVLILSHAFNLLGAAWVVFFHGPASFILGYGIISGLSGIGASTGYVLLFRWFRHHKGKATAILTSASSIGLAVCTPLFVRNPDLSWQDAFLLTSLIGLFAMLPMGLVLLPKSSATAAPAAPPPLNPTPGSALSLLKHPLLVAVGFALFTCGFNMGTVEMNLVTIHRSAEVSPSVIAFSMSLLGIMEIAGALVFGYVLDRAARTAVMALLYLLRVTAFVLLYLHLGLSPVLFSLLFGLTYLSAVPGGLMAVQDRFPQKGRTTGLLLLLHQAGGIVGAFMSGLLFDRTGSHQLLLSFNAALCLAACLAYLTLTQASSIKKIRMSRRETSG